MSHDRQLVDLGLQLHNGSQLRLVVASPTNRSSKHCTNKESIDGSMARDSIQGETALETADCI